MCGLSIHLDLFARPLVETAANLSVPLPRPPQSVASRERGFDARRRATRPRIRALALARVKEEDGESVP